MSSVIKIENLSKAYQLGEIGTGTISRDLERWWARARGKEDPLLKIGETNDRRTKGNSDVVWSLKDINLDIQQGDAVGIIGRNGAGKSTLLKILSRVTAPTTGSIKIKGRVASLLEVGTGFHPELSGRENIFLNGAILGMRKAEIKKHFDAIVDFSGVERYIDTPVKRYSSGMYVRLAFAVAAHLESEILIVDEVLAVGDAEFQKKCLGKMTDVSKGEGRTVLFVSHNAEAINNLCKKVILLENGLVIFDGNVSEGYERYQIKNECRPFFNTPVSQDLRHLKAYISSINLLNDAYSDLSNDEDLLFDIKIACHEPIEDHRIGLRFKSGNDSPVGLLFSQNIITMTKDTETHLLLTLKNHNLSKGTYLVDVALGVGNEESPIQELHVISEALIIQITKKNKYSADKISSWNHTNWGNINFNNFTLEIKAGRV